MNLDLNDLLDWTRRTCGDRSARTTETIASDGTDTITLSNEGGITLISVSVDRNAVDIDTLTIDGPDITFPSNQTSGAEVKVVYGLTRYTDDEILEFLVDASNTVASDLHIDWQVISDTAKIMNLPDDALNKDKSAVDQGVEKLIVYAAAHDIISDKGNQAADDAIMVKDNKTTIDTSKTSATSEKAIQRMKQRYADALTRYRSDRFTGKFQEDRDVAWYRMIPYGA